MQHTRHPLAQGSLIALAAVLVLLAAACSETVEVEPLQPDEVILAFGDSVTYGTGAARGRDYPRQLAEKTGMEVINAGIPGDTAAAAKRRIESLLERYRPGLVIVELGGNDFLARRSPARVKQDLQELLQLIRNRGIPAVLVAVPEFSVLRATTGTLKDAELYRQLGEDQGVVVIEDLFAGILSDDNLRADPIHPNAQGYEVLAEGIYRALVAAGYLNEYTTGQSSF